MELKLSEYTIPEVIGFNYEELKKEVTEKVAKYKTMVYTDATIQDAKKDRAGLNAFIKALDDKRKEVKKECLAPYEAFAGRIDELKAIVGEPVAVIDAQVKEYEEDERQKKREEIERFYESEVQADCKEWLELSQIFKSQWLNKSVSLKQVCAEINEIVAQIEADVKTINGLPGYAFEALEHYKIHIDLNGAIAEATRLSEQARRKAEATKMQEEAEAAKKQEEIQQAQKQEEIQQAKKQDAAPVRSSITDVPVEIRFRARMTTLQAQKLHDFCMENGIEIERMEV